MNKVRKNVSDLGVSSFLKMNGFSCKGRKGRNYIFDISEEDQNQFNCLLIEYENSPYAQFDACLMSLKRLPPDYISGE